MLFIFCKLLPVYFSYYTKQHPPKQEQNLLEFIVFLLTVYLSVDMAESMREAFSLKELLLGLESSSGEFRHLQKGIEVAYAFYGSELKEKSEAGLKKINSALGAGKEKGENVKASIMERVERARTKRTYKNISSLLGRNPHAVSKMHEKAFLEFLEIMKERGVGKR